MIVCALSVHLAGSLVDPRTVPRPTSLPKPATDASWQDRRRLRAVRRREEVTEVGVTGHNDSVLLPGDGEDLTVGRRTQSEVSDVDRVVTRVRE